MLLPEGLVRFIPGCKNWTSHQPPRGISKPHAQAVDLATLWEYLPLEGRNPIEIVKVKNVTMRTNEVLVLSAEQSARSHRNCLSTSHDRHDSGVLGLQVSETLGLQWSDIGWEKQTVSIRRSAYRGSIDNTKKKYYAFRTDRATIGHTPNLS